MLFIGHWLSLFIPLTPTLLSDSHKRKKKCSPLNVLYNYIMGCYKTLNKTTQPIRTKNKIAALLTYLKGSNMRDFTLCKLLLNTGLRVSDAVGLRWDDILTPSGSFKEYLTLNEKKTGVQRSLKLNETLKSALRDWHKHSGNSPWIFPSRRTDADGHITTKQAYRVLTHAANDVGIENFGCHALRKTWGYWSYLESKYNIALIQATFGHANPSDTLRYIGIEQHDKDRLFSLVQL